MLLKNEKNRQQQECLPLMRKYRFGNKRLINSNLRSFKNTWHKKSILVLFALRLSRYYFSLKEMRGHQIQRSNVSYIKVSQSTTLSWREGRCRNLQNEDIHWRKVEQEIETSGKVNGERGLHLEEKLIDLLFKLLSISLLLWNLCLFEHLRCPRESSSLGDQNEFYGFCVYAKNTWSLLSQEAMDQKDTLIHVRSSSTFSDSMFHSLDSLSLISSEGWLPSPRKRILDYWAERCLFSRGFPFLDSKEKDRESDRMSRTEKSHPSSRSTCNFLRLLPYLYSFSR
jgi:hypothetical protein